MLNRQATNRDYSNAIDNKLKAYKVYGKTYGPCLSDKLLRHVVHSYLSSKDSWKHRFQAMDKGNKVTIKSFFNDIFYVIFLPLYWLWQISKRIKRLSSPTFSIPLCATWDATGKTMFSVPYSYQERTQRSTDTCNMSKTKQLWPQFGQSCFFICLLKT